MNNYHRQVRLLVQLLGLVDSEKCFALKGGTAINLFMQNLPRLSVDIDLVYLPNENRETALKNIKEALDSIAKLIKQQFTTASVVKSYLHKDDALRLVVTVKGVMIKVELSPVLRGTVFPTVRKSVVDKVEDMFGYAEIEVVSMADLYASKFCAALDRQHPRDLFDVKLFLDNQNFDTDIRRAFIVYLISHPRPISEILNPKTKSLSQVYESEFKGMTFVETSLHELEESLIELIKMINHSLSDDEKQFILSFQKNQANWNLLRLDHVEELSAVKWKQLNIAKMSEQKLNDEVSKLKQIFGLS
ncbi:MAG: nucleotidyl transferase AbiEii/AbiGii toxin family protein [Proteobacteria bacterium]|nr:nucleotidyl transferase AbiEii/AbiGii toxin family protein [Pseudomonadota bacterium]